jgi:hypothetical protein
VRVAALLALGLVLSGCAVGGTKTTTVTTTTIRTVVQPPGAKNATYFGTPVSVTKLDAKRYALTIKPELFLIGVTANVAFAAQQGNACTPLECPGVDNDHIVLPAGSQNLLFLLPATTKGTVIDQHMHNVTVTPAQLSAIVAGGKTPKLIEPLDSGLWLTVDGDTVKSFAQQFQP